MRHRTDPSELLHGPAELLHGPAELVHSAMRLTPVALDKPTHVGSFTDVRYTVVEYKWFCTNDSLHKVIDNEIGGGARDDQRRAVCTSRAQ